MAKSATKGTDWLVIKASLIQIYPLFVAYELVTVAAGAQVNGVDVVTPFLWKTAGSDLYFVLGHVAVATVLALVLSRSRWRSALSRPYITATLVEAALYGLGLATAALLLRQYQVASIGSCATNIGVAFSTAAGAGLFEELVFRLAAMGGLVFLCQRLGSEGRRARLLALVISSLGFAAAHHVGTGGEAFVATTFAFRACAGLVFGWIFIARSLACAVYAHFFYDLYVLVPGAFG